MDEPARLPTGFWVMAGVRRAQGLGLGAYIAHRGDAERGAVLLKLALLDGTARVLTQVRDLDGRLGWMDALPSGAAPEPDADAYTARALGRDPDLWLVEVEDRQGRNPFVEG